MALVIEMEAVGGPEVLRAVDANVGAPGAGEVQIRQATIGVNFIDIYHRIGLYPLPRLPAVLGVEGAGTITAVGAGVTSVQIGDRVAYAGVPPGGYAELRCLPQARVINLPDDISERVAGSTLLRGLTAHMLMHKVHLVAEGQFILVHAAAGGLGQLLTRWAKLLGATVIGTVGSASKIAMAEQAGADRVVLHTSADWPAEVKAFSEGRGVHVAYDGIGGATLGRTFASVRPFGLVASLGQAAGEIPPLCVDELGPVRSISLSRPSVVAYTSDPALYRPAAADLFAALRDGLTNPIGAEYPLHEAARAQADLEAGRTTGSVVLLP